MADEKGTLEEGIRKAKTDVVGLEATAKTARADADKAWSSGKTDEAGRKVIMQAESQAESHESALARARGTVTRLEGALADLGKQASRDSVEPIHTGVKRVVLAELERHEALIGKSPGLTGFAFTVDLATASGKPTMSDWKPAGDWFTRVGTGRKGGGGGSTKGQKYTFLVDGNEYDARGFIDSEAGARCISPERVKAVQEGKAGATAVALAGAKVMGIVPVPAQPTAPTA